MTDERLTSRPLTGVQPLADGTTLHGSPAVRIDKGLVTAGPVKPEDAER